MNEINNFVKEYNCEILWRNEVYDVLWMKERNNFVKEFNCVILWRNEVYDVLWMNEINDIIFGKNEINYVILWMIWILVFCNGRNWYYSVKE